MTPAAYSKEWAAPTSSAPSRTPCFMISSPSSQHRKPFARSWRHLWRSIKTLRLIGLDRPGPVQDFQKFVDNLLNLREHRTDLRTVEIKFSGCWADDLPYVNQWIHSAVMCKVRSLTFHHLGPFLYLNGPHLASRHLRKVDLAGVAVQDTFLGFSSCPALEDLKMNACDICVDEISSRSLKHLSITDCVSHYHCRLHVSALGLVSLKLDGIWGLAPFFDENMALLETARVNIGSYCTDICRIYVDSGIFCGADNACSGCDDCSDPVLLGGISSARHLELISKFRNFIFARDLEHRPIFSNVKTLLLNEYCCVAPGCDRLAYVLKNSPILEKLTLQLFSKGPNHKVEMKGSYTTMEGLSAISEHLKIVEVKCNAVDERILEILKFLSAFNIRFSSLEG
uniref:Uncharacterized protein n=1 Tax=Avena sativa TaxID=4498 RepID=A0ACD5ZBT4_AVESA